MKLKLHLFAGVAAVSALSLTTWAQTAPSTAPATKAETKAAERLAAPGDPSPTPLGKEKAFDEFTKIHVRNFQDEPLGRIKDLGIDLVNGRIVEVLIALDSALDSGNKVVAVPPLALFPDIANEVYRLNVNADVMKSAPAIDLKKWEDQGRSQRVAAAYQLFGQEPYFLEEGAAASTTESRPKVSLGYVERSTKILDLPVGNPKGDKFGKVWSMTMDIPKGRIMNVIVLAPGNFKTKSIIPATALSFNASRDALLLDDTKMEFADEPRFVFTEAQSGNDAHSKEEAYKGKRTSMALEQGSSYRDVDRTVLISKDIRAAKINARNVEVGTINGRVTLRGWVNTNEEKRQINDIAVRAARVEAVDNQITVGKPMGGN
ncbi:MAG: BON domain-containing protein [Undibacterium sp.]|nr:BON domain-containing protein [Opitutaceae bacterium]